MGCRKRPVSVIAHVPVEGLTACLCSLAAVTARRATTTSRTVGRFRGAGPSDSPLAGTERASVPLRGGPRAMLLEKVDGEGARHRRVDLGLAAGDEAGVWSNQQMRSARRAPLPAQSDRGSVLPPGAASIPWRVLGSLKLPTEAGSPGGIPLRRVKRRRPGTPPRRGRPTSLAPVRCSLHCRCWRRRPPVSGAALDGGGAGDGGAAPLRQFRYPLLGGEEKDPLGRLRSPASTPPRRFRRRCRSAGRRRWSPGRRPRGGGRRREPLGGACWRRR